MNQNQTLTQEREVQKAAPGQPKGLYVIFVTGIWERFSYYGMRALLVLFLASQLIKGGFGWDRAHALEIYAVFTGLVYLTPLIGGVLADKFLGQRITVYIGGILMAAGYVALSLCVGDGSPTVAPAVLLSREYMLYAGLGLLIAGNGFFKPTITSMVGELYEKNDVRRDSGFTIFYMGINIGAFLAPLICGTLGEVYGWAYGFMAAGIGISLGLVFFIFTEQKLNHVGLPPKSPLGKLRLGSVDWTKIVTIAAISAALVFGIIKLASALSPTAYNWSTKIIYLLGALYVAYAIFTGTKGKDEWSRVGVIFILAFFNILFFAGFEQAGGTFNLFAEENTIRTIGSITIPTSWFQAINPLAIFAIAPMFAGLWIWLSRRNSNPNTPVKFGLGMVFLGLGFVVMYFASKSASVAEAGKISAMWLVAVYLIHTVGELFLSPIGLSMITKLSPPKIVSLMMGLWFGSNALANYGAGVLENVLKNQLPNMNLFLFLVITSIAGGVVLLIISPILKRMMKGID